MPSFYKKNKKKKNCLILLFFPLSDLFLHQFLDKILYFSSSQAAYYMLQNTSSNCFSWYNDIKKPHFSFLRYAVMVFYPYAGFHSLYSLILYIRGVYHSSRVSIRRYSTGVMPMASCMRRCSVRTLAKPASSATTAMV